MSHHISSLISSTVQNSGRDNSSLSLFSPNVRKTIITNSWTPLNPNLAHRYYDTFKSNWVIKSCYNEKIRAGFSGGFDIEYGPENNRINVSSPSVKKSNPKRGGKKAKRNKRKGNGKDGSSSNNIYSGISDTSFGDSNVSSNAQKDQKLWIEDIMKKAEMYRDILGIVAFKRVVTPLGEVRFEIVDITLGYFVGRITEEYSVQYGFRYYDSAGINGILPNSKYNYNGAFSTFTLGGDVQHEPNPSVHVYSWPGYEPDVGCQAPFKSNMAVIYRNALETAEMMDNELIGHYKMTHPTFVTEPMVQSKVPGDQTEHEILLDVAGNLRADESQSYFYRKRINQEMSIHLSNTMRNINEKISGKRKRVIGLNLDGTETTVSRRYPWEDNMYVTPVGTRVGKGPEARVRTDIIQMLRFKAAEVATVFSVPLPGIVGVATGSKGTKAGAQTETNIFRRTLVEMRYSMARFFESAYMSIIAKAENIILSNILTDMNMGKSDEESMVRSYVRNVLKTGDGGIGTSGKYNVQKRVSTDPTLGDSYMNNYENDKKKGKSKKKDDGGNNNGDYEIDSTTGVTLEQSEKYKQDLYELELEKASISRAEENRKIYQSSEENSNGPSVSQGVKTPYLLTKDVRKSSWEENKDNRSSNLSNRIRNIDDPIGAKYSSSAGEFIPSIEQYTNGFIPRGSMATMDRFEREIQDQLSHQKYLEKIEKAKWHRFMQDQNQMEQRISRIMYTALTNYGVSLNPDAIRKSLRAEIEKDPSLSNTFGAEIKDPNEIVENYLVEEMMSQRKGFLNDILLESKRINIVWKSTPMPDLDKLIMAFKEGLDLPQEMIVDIIAEEQGMSERLKYYRKRQKLRDRENSNPNANKDVSSNDKDPKKKDPKNKKKEPKNTKNSSSSSPSPSSNSKSIEKKSPNKKNESEEKK